MNLAYLADSLIDFFFVRVHLDEGSNLSQVDIFTIAERHDFVESKYQIESILSNIRLLQAATILGDLLMSGQKSISHHHHQQLKKNTLTTRANKRNVSKSSKMFEALVVMSSTYILSNG